MANYFIDRPVFAWVLAIIMMLAGGLAIMNLPVAQYPQIAPPTITVSATYPGADAQTVEDSVTQVIEQNMNGLDGLMYMSSTSDAAGNASANARRNTPSCCTAGKRNSLLSRAKVRLTACKSWSPAGARGERTLRRRKTCSG